MPNDHWPDPEAWAAHVRAALIPGPCLLDLTPGNILTYSMGTVSSLEPVRSRLLVFLFSFNLIFIPI